MSINLVTNSDVELALTRAIPELLHELGVLPGLPQCEVHLHRGDRKKRRNARFEENWNPGSDSIRVVLSPVKDKVESTTDNAATSPGMEHLEPAEDRLSDLIRALDHAERYPDHRFVSLTWFRNTSLLHEGYPWAVSGLARHDVLHKAIDRHWILLSKVENPKRPRFPVTAIRLNRQIAEVNAILGFRANRPPAFRPVDIRDEPLSATVLHDGR